jgi:cystathionine beta-lyase
MSEKLELNRRKFIQGAGATAIAGALGTGASLASAAGSMKSGGMMKYNFDKPYNRFGSNSVKWDQQVDRFGAENIEVGMGIADMDFQTAPCITEALEKRTAHNNWGYQKMPYDEYIEGIVAWNKERHGLDVDPETIQLQEGVHHGLISTLRTVSPPKSKVLMMTPTYNGFYGDLRWTQTETNESVMTFKNGTWSVDWDDFEERMTPDTHAFLLCNPQNPTGNVWSKKDLMRMGKLCLENDVLVLADEIHCDFLRKGVKYTPFASLRDKDIVNNSVTFKGLSKTFSLAAMKSSYYFTTNPILQARIKRNHRSSQNSLGMIANNAAYHQGADWFDQLLPYIDSNHDLVEKYLKEKLPSVGFTIAQGTYFGWLDFSNLINAIGAKKAAMMTEGSDDPKTPSEILETWLVMNAKVHLNAGSHYGKGAENHMRMNLGTSKANITHALDNIAKAIAKL